VLLDFLDPMVIGPNPVSIATIPFRGNCRSFLGDPVFPVRFASRCGNLSFTDANIFDDRSVSFGVGVGFGFGFGFGFCATLRYPAQHARLRRPAEARRLRR
jgi:hypothetical protein